ncbi:hypothetical protein SBI_02675 [Streptomyces bingchenggensis BCW-1]|uniref:Uncharacterized protein n=2 Tax=Streptomyces TaxID=1883 RepID=D7C0S4_STRBB|nr:hypothetical protein SBI_02675 [Streptomyces bingchenggensis BCW-1]
MSARGRCPATPSAARLADLRDVLGTLRHPQTIAADAAPAPVLRDVHERILTALEVTNRLQAALLARDAGLG